MTNLDSPPVPRDTLLMNPETLDGVQALLGHTFADPVLLQQALLHRSFLHENADYALLSNERLEFLGDAFLGYMVATELYRLYPDEPEGVLTKLRAGVVQGDTLAAAARALGLGGYLVMGRGEERTGGRNRTSNLAHVYEAIVGALLLDSGEIAAQTFVAKTLGNAIRDVSAGVLGADYKSALQELCQAQKWLPPVYQTIAEEGPAHAKRFEVAVVVNDKPQGHGEGSSRQRAEKAAAKVALAALLSSPGTAS